MKKLSSALIFLLLLTLPCLAQTSDAPPPPDSSLLEESTSNNSIESILATALNLASSRDWEAALQLLNAAKRIEPNNEKIDTYITSIKNLQKLDSAQNSWVEGEPSQVITDDTQSQKNSKTEEEDSPKFVIERDKDDVRANPDQFRNLFRGELIMKPFAYNPTNMKWENTWSSSDEVLYSTAGMDLLLWFPLPGRSFGINISSSGYAWQPGKPDTLLNMLNAGLNLRGFLAEKQQSRLEIGIDFGITHQSTLNTINTTIEYKTALYLGLRASDALFYHLFKLETLNKLLIGGAIRIYAPLDIQVTGSVHYSLDASWYFKWSYWGLRLEWWDFSTSSGRQNVPAISLFWGIHFR